MQPPLRFRVQKGRFCNRARQGVCVERGSCDPEVPPPQPLKGQRSGAGFRGVLTQLAACAMILSLQNIWRRRRLGPGPGKPASRDLSSLPVSVGCFTSLPFSISPLVKQLFAFEKLGTDDARYQVFSPSWKTDSCTDLFTVSCFCHT